MERIKFTPVEPHFRRFTGVNMFIEIYWLWAQTVEHPWERDVFPDVIL